MYAERLKIFTQLYNKISSAYGSTQVFSDFVKMCAISIYNAFAKNKEMEKEYLQTINSYTKEYQLIFSKMFGELIMMYEESNGIMDILGPFYEKENLGNSHLGQFFTPSHISDFMAEISLEDEEKLKTIIDKRGFVSMCEPTCGAGGMILSTAKALERRNIDYQQELLVEATDISEVCVYMAYIQLSLYGIPAIVYCGNALANEFRFKMETPFFFLNYWKFRKFYMQNSDGLQESNEKSIIENAVKNQDLFKEVTIKGNCQVSLW